MPNTVIPLAREALVITVVLLCVTAGGCGSSTPESVSMSARDRCNAEQKVAITVIQDSKLTGYYRCAYGTLNCLHMNETGKVVHASLNQSRVTIRVAMPDGTSCLYSGLIKNDAVRGGYSCYAGGATIEQGSWQGQGGS